MGSQRLTIQHKGTILPDFVPQNVASALVDAQDGPLGTVPRAQIMHLRMLTDFVYAIRIGQVWIVV